MRLAFIASCLEPGRDGVGDYARRLGGELQRRGHTVSLLALNDAFCADEIVDCTNEFRCSTSLPWRERIRRARSFLAKRNPEVLSLQFVSYGFHELGMPLGISRRLLAVANRPAAWHVMLHELWTVPDHTLRKRLISAIQKRLLLSLCASLNPKAIHTSNGLYVARLRDAGLQCAVLPMFGNIPVTTSNCPRTEGEWTFILFGSLRRGWSPEPLLSRIEAARMNAGKACCRIVSVGRLGASGNAIWQDMTRLGYQRFTFERLGEMGEKDISLALHAADFGIAVSPLDFIGKSGAVAAMREHGLPVIINRIERYGSAALSLVDELKSPDEVSLAAPLVLLDDCFEMNLTRARRCDTREILPCVADRFLDSLSATK